MARFLYRLGRGAARRRRLVVVAWVVAALGIIVVSQAAGGTTSNDFKVPSVEAQKALDVLEDDFPAAAGTSAQLVFAADEGEGTLTDQGPAAAVASVLADVDQQPHVIGVGELQVSSIDPHIGYAEVQYDQPTEDLKDAGFARLERLADSTNDKGVVTVELGGELPSAGAEAEFGGQEMIGLLVAIVVLLAAFGSVVAMGLPIGVALVGLMTGMGLIGLVAAVVDVSTFVPTIATMIGLGVGIDYALFIVTRHRENLRKGMAVEDSVGHAIATSGAAVLFAGITVMIAISGLAIAGIPTVTVMGVATGMTVAVMMAVALTLLPALLGFAGPRINALRVPGMAASAGLATSGRESMWHRWGRQVSAHPWRYLMIGALSLGVLTAPVLGLRLGMPDNGTQSDTMTTRRAYDLLSDGFGAGFNGPLLLSVELGPSADADAVLDRLGAALEADPGIDEVHEPQVNDDGTAAVIQVVPTTAPQDEDTTQLIHHLRGSVLPSALGSGSDTSVYVGGQTAMFVDISERVEQRLPWFIGAVILVSVLLLMMVFRSVAVPLKAAAMNLLSIGAAYGVIVAVFQWGWGRSLFGVDETVPIVSFLPMMLFAILFGLSMDYEVFLLSRVREEYLARRHNDEAVVEGIAATARVITSAALIMISVFAGFVLSADPTVKMFGLGLATAVLVDATIVRVVLVPATMRLLGDWNWWLPGWLDRLLPKVSIEADPIPTPADESPDRDREPVLVG